uniref:Uncharacterized protein n=1 Tax=Rhizophora mucronata TaxID=61149 RepID=A0A2P2MXT4_RHIMU
MTIVGFVLWALLILPVFSILHFFHQLFYITLHLQETIRGNYQHISW